MNWYQPYSLNSPNGAAANGVSIFQHEYKHSHDSEGTPLPWRQWTRSFLRLTSRFGRSPVRPLLQQTTKTQLFTTSTVERFLEEEYALSFVPRTLTIV